MRTRGRSGECGVSRADSRKEAGKEDKAETGALRGFERAPLPEVAGNSGEKSQKKKKRSGISGKGRGSRIFKPRLTTL